MFFTIIFNLDATIFPNMFSVYFLIIFTFAFFEVRKLLLILNTLSSIYFHYVKLVKLFLCYGRTGTFHYGLFYCYYLLLISINMTPLKLKIVISFCSIARPNLKTNNLPNIFTVFDNR